MRTKIILTIFILILIICTNSWACSNSLTCKNASKSSETKTICNDVKDPNVILKKLNQNTLTLKSYQCRIEYLFNQPLFESKTLRKGDLYYKKSNGKTKLRINFNILKQDDEKEKQYMPQNCKRPNNAWNNPCHRILLINSRCSSIDSQLSG